MLGDLFMEHAWAAALFVAVLMYLDYYLSLLGLKWYRKGADAHYDFGGSYELNPPFERDIEELRPVSLKHLLGIAGAVFLIVVTWWFTARAGRLEGIYAAVVGFYILVQVPVQIRHAQNLLLFRFVVVRGGVEGKTLEPRWLQLKLSGTLFWAFAAFYLLLFALTGDALFIGGVVAGLLMGARFWIFGGEAEKD